MPESSVFTRRRVFLARTSPLARVTGGSAFTRYPLGVLVALCAAVMLFAGCHADASDGQRQTACENYAKLAMDEFPGGDELGAEAQSARQALLADYCTDELEQGDAISESDAECMAKAASLEDIAVCRSSRTLMDKLSGS